MISFFRIFFVFGIYINQQLYNDSGYKRNLEAKFTFEFSNEFYSSSLNEVVNWLDNRKK